MLVPKTFYMLRHGETIANVMGYAAGSVDSPLTEKGRLQAQEARADFKKHIELPDVIAHSPLSRARDTAIILNQKINVSLYESAKLSEQCFGDWAGMSWSAMRDLMEQGQNPPNGETINFFYERAIEGINEILSLPYRRPLIVTHGGVFDAFWSFYNYKMIDVENCHLYKLTPSEQNKKRPWDVFMCSTNIAVG